MAYLSGRELFTCTRKHNTPHTGSQSRLRTSDTVPGTGSYGQSFMRYHGSHNYTTRVSANSLRRKCRELVARHERGPIYLFRIDGLEKSDGRRRISSLSKILDFQCDTFMPSPLRLRKCVSRNSLQLMSLITYKDV